MRKAVALEGPPSIDGRILVPGCLRPAERAFIPVRWSGLGIDAAVGRAVELQRDERPYGFEVSFDFQFHPDLRERLERGHTAHIAVSPYDTELDSKGRMVVWDAIIREIYLSETTHGDWPWPDLKPERNIL